MVIGNERPQTTLSPEFAAKLEAHRARVAELRKEIPDPAAALDEIVRSVFTLEALLSSIRLSEGGEWLGFREDDEDEE
jgi:hypothetical protein